MAKKITNKRGNTAEQNKNAGSKGTKANQDKYQKCDSVKPMRNGNTNSSGTDARGTNNYVVRGQRDLSKAISNDPKWWNKNANDYALSTMLQWDKTLGIPVTSGDTTWAPPQILRIDYIPCPGLAKTSADGVNKALEILMTQMYAATTGGNLDFERADIGLLMTSMASIAAMIGAAKRALAFSTSWVTRNTAYPMRVLQSMGFDYFEITQDRPSLISQLNQEIRRFNSIKFPALVDYFDRCYMLASNIFCDEDSPLAQLYYWMPMGYYLYDDTQSKCVWTKYSPVVYPHETNNHTVLMYEYIETIQKALDAWFNTDDLRNINGAFQRCFGTESAYFIPELTLADTVTPHTDEYLSQQLMNMNILKYSEVDPESLNITQDPYHNLLIYQPHSVYTKDEAPNIIGGTHILRTYKDNPTADDNMEMTRFQMTGGQWTDLSITGEQKTAWYLNSFGTELVTGMTIVWSDGADQGSYTCRSLTLGTNQITVDNSAKALSAIKELSRLLAFRYTPQFVVTWTDTIDGVQVNRSMLLGDLANYTVVSDGQIYDMNRAAILSIWKLTRE